MAITTMADLMAALPGQSLPFITSSGVSVSADTGSYWTKMAFPPQGLSAGSVNGAITTSATVGAMSFVNAAAGKVTEVGQIVVATQSTVPPGSLYLYDRLWHNSQLVGNVATSQAFTMPALTRSTSGVGVELWAECYTTLGVTGVTATATYTNSAGTGSRTATTATLPAPFSVGAAVRFPLQAGDVGVQSVQSVILSASTGTAGNWGLTLMKRIAEIPMFFTATPRVFDGFDLGFPRVDDGACLIWFGAASTGTTLPAVSGQIHLIQG